MCLFLCASFWHISMIAREVNSLIGWEFVDESIYIQYLYTGGIFHCILIRILRRYRFFLVMFLFVSS